MNIAFRQVPLLRSFLEDYSIHAVASEDPALLGGPYVHLKASDIPAVRTLLEDTLARCGDMMRFAEDFVRFDRKLQAEAKGSSIDTYYAELPSSLRGLIEIAYDLNNRPTVRVFEELLYRGGLENQGTQEISFSSERDEDRDFFLNTPRLASGDRLIVPIRFDHPVFDSIADARLHSVSFEHLADALWLPSTQHERFGDFFTNAAPARNNPQYQGDAVRIRYFGHACVLMQTSSTSVLVDPYVAWDQGEDSGTLSFHDLPDYIDYVLITHSHQDHCCPEVILQLRNRIGTLVVPRNNPHNIADPSLKLLMRRLGFANVIVLDPLEALTFRDGQLLSLPFFGEHCGLNVLSKQTFLVEMKGRKLLFLADSAGVDPDLYKHLAVGPVDVIFLGMECRGAPLTWLYGPYLSSPVGRRDDESRRLSGANCEQAWAILKEVPTARAYIYAMGQEPWLKFMMGLQYRSDSIQILESNLFIERCRRAGIDSERLYGTKQFFV